MTTADQDTTVDLAHYSAALDEIFRLRRALAYEARVIQSHLSYATFPKGRRPAAIDQIERMRGAARGDAEREYAGVSAQALDHVMRNADALPTLTRSQWEAR